MSGRSLSCHLLVSTWCILLMISVDLFGRGWSGTPIGVPQDSGLFTTQVLLAITSSPISWTSTECGGFSLIGYSLGGGLVMSFAAYFPQLLSSVVLLAPSGLIRSVHADYQNVLLRYNWMIPSSWLRTMVRRILCGDNLIEPACNEAEQEVCSDPTAKHMLRATDTVSISQKSFKLNITDVVHWQLDCNEGFVDSFLNSLKYAPISKQHAYWRMIRVHFDEIR